MKLKFLATAALAMTAGALLLIPATPAGAQNQIEPIPGVDIIVKKKPGGGIVVVATTDREGRFSGRFAEPGDYTISFACRAKAPCPRFAATLAANGQPLKSSEAMTYDLTVGGEPVVLTGTVAALDAHAAAPATDAAATLAPQCPEVAAAQAQGQTRQAINTSRSNIKHPAAAQAEGDQPCDPAATEDAPARR